MLNLLITLEIIMNYLCTMHHEYHDFNGVHVYLGSIRISLDDLSVMLRRPTM